MRLKTNTSLLYMQLHVFVLQEVIFIFQKNIYILIGAQNLLTYEYILLFHALCICE